MTIGSPVMWYGGVVPDKDLPHIVSAIIAEVDYVKVVIQADFMKLITKA